MSALCIFSAFDFFFISILLLLVHNSSEIQFFFSLTFRFLRNFLHFIFSHVRSNAIIDLQLTLLDIHLHLLFMLRLLLLVQHLMLVNFNYWNWIPAWVFFYELFFFFFVPTYSVCFFFSYLSLSRVIFGLAWVFYWRHLLLALVFTFAFVSIMPWKLHYLLFSQQYFHDNCQKNADQYDRCKNYDVCIVIVCYFFCWFFIFRMCANLIAQQCDCACACNLFQIFFCTFCLFSLYISL